MSCIDLLFVALTAGRSLPQAVNAVGAVGNGPVAAALGRVSAALGRGVRLSDALEGLVADLGPALRPLSTTLGSAAAAGTPLGPALQRLADAERRRSRRRTEERVRRLPVLLLVPLVTLVLPAFGLLTVVPVGITTVRHAVAAADSPADPQP